MSKDVDPLMHTAEHLLNQTMVRLIGTERCFSAHIEKKKSKCDYRFNRNLSNQEMVLIETSINQIIQDDLPVFAEMTNINEAREKYDLSKLPDNLNSLNELRIIKIGDYDAVPCIGPHAASTKELGLFKFVSSSFDDNILRIRYKLFKK